MFRLPLVLLLLPCLGVELDLGLELELELELEPELLRLFPELEGRLLLEPEFELLLLLGLLVLVFL